jgi:pimeloyl-ACP methyl ester carboxylesterase
VPEPAPVELAVREEGSGSAIVLIHGLGGDRLLWNAVIPTLAATHRVLAPDLRGHGRSPSPAGATYALDEFVADLLAVLDRRGIEAAHWVGLSAGGFVALRLALDHPGRTRSLTTVSSAAYLDSHSRAVMERWWSTAAEEGREALAVRLLKDLYYPDWVEAHLDVVDRMHDEVATRAYGPAVAWGRQLGGFDERNRIAALRCPTLIVQGMDDQVVDASHGRILRQSIPGATIRILAQTGHLIPIERPAELAEAILEVVRRAEAPTA